MFGLSSTPHIQPICGVARTRLGMSATSDWPILTPQNPVPIPTPDKTLAICLRPLYFQSVPLRPSPPHPLRSSPAWLAADLSLAGPDPSIGSSLPARTRRALLVAVCCSLEDTGAPAWETPRRGSTGQASSPPLPYCMFRSSNKIWDAHYFTCVYLNLQWHAHYFPNLGIMFTVLYALSA